MKDIDTARLGSLAKEAGDPHANWLKARIDLSMEFAAIEKLVDGVGALQQAVVDAERALKDAQKDANRYRHIRSTGSGVLAAHTWWECGCLPAELDAAIDAAIAAKEQTE